MKYIVYNTLTGEKDSFQTLQEAQDHVKTQIEWYNSPNENKNGNGYTEDDFPINHN